MAMGGLIDVRYHGDDRREGWFDIFGPTNLGIKDVNVVHIPKAGTTVAWHKHHRQTDAWFCPQGLIQAGVAGEDREHTFYFLRPNLGKVLMISPGLWHGYRTLEDNTILVYGLTQKYDPEDEFRMSVETMGISWELGAR